MYFNSLRFQLHVIEIHTIPMLALFDTTDFVVYTPHCFHSTIIIMQSDYVRVDGVMVDRVILEGRRDDDMPSYQASWHAFIPGEEKMADMWCKELFELLPEAAVSMLLVG